MNRKIELLKMEGLVVVPGDMSPEDNRTLAYSLNLEMMRLGYVMSQELLEVLSKMDRTRLVKLAKDTVQVLRKAKGDNVKHQPMYKNFPEQVMEMHEIELYLNAIVHYWTMGRWKPEHKKELRGLATISNKLKSVSLLSEDDFSNHFTKLLRSNDSLSKGDKAIVEWYLNYHDNLIFPDVIPYKETVCMLTAYYLNKDKPFEHLIGSATDILRLATYLSDGDVSLAENTKFKSFGRPIRRKLVNALEKVISEEDISRHRNKWGKLFHNLHVCEYSTKVCGIAKKVRSNKKLYSTMSAVEALLQTGDFTVASELLQHRPGEFARRLDHLVRDTSKKDGKEIAGNFDEVSEKVSTRVLMQLMGHLKVRSQSEERVVFPKGSIAKAQKIGAPVGTVRKKLISRIQEDASKTLIERFGELDSLGKVYIDPVLGRCPLPAAQRSASEGLRTVARGTRMPLDDGNTLRLFIHWLGNDIDLSATLHDENMVQKEHISYTHLRSKYFESCHSGDITYAPGPDGASEFIDITLDKLLEGGLRYIAMNVLVYSGPTFGEHERCFAGWMMRSNAGSGEIFEPRTVQGKCDLTVESKNAIPVIFDALTREAIWCDMATRRNTRRGGNNVESNRANIEDVTTSLMNLHNRATLWDLFMMHALGRGEVTEVREEADTVFAWDGDVTPFDINTINADYLV